MIKIRDLAEALIGLPLEDSARITILVNGIEFTSFDVRSASPPPGGAKHLHLNGSARSREHRPVEGPRYHIVRFFETGRPDQTLYASGSATSFPLGTALNRVDANNRDLRHRLTLLGIGEQLEHKVRHANFRITRHQ